MSMINIYMELDEVLSDGPETVRLREKRGADIHLRFERRGSLRFLLAGLLAAVEGVAGEDIPAFLEAGRKAVGLDV